MPQNLKMSETDKKTVKEESVLGQKKASMEEESLHPVSLTHNDYTVGWVCALPKEQTAALAMLDQRHPQLSKPPNDHNTYTLGSIGRHNIVIACLPKGQIGTNSAATVATRMVGTFPSIKFGLMVGIGGGIPPKVRLGDVVVSTPVGQHPGVVQWDLGKAEEGGKFERTGALNNPPSELLSALTILESEHALNGTKIPQYLGEISQKWPNLAPRYLWSDSLKDPLFSTDDSHTRINWERIIASLAGFLIGWWIGNGDRGMKFTGIRQLIIAFLTYLMGWWITANIDRRMKSADISQRKPGEMRVYYGLIASGNQVIKDAKFRNRLNDSLGGNVLCVEMEAAGLKDFPCLVVRGICDYADSHKNKDWQEHAAAVAAAFSKEFLMVVPTQDVEQMPMIKLLQDIDGRLEKVSKTIDQQGDERVLSWLSPNDYTIQQNQFLQRRQPGTGQWFLDSTEYRSWLGEAYQTLFCPGIPGAGKTTLASIIVDDLYRRFSEDRTIGIAYIYCDFRRKDEQSFEQLLSNLLKQLSQSQLAVPEIVKRFHDQFTKGGRQVEPSVAEKSTVLQSVLGLFSRVFVVIDALDECDVNCRNKLVKWMFDLQAEQGINIIATSRLVTEIANQFRGCSSLEIRARDGDIRSYVDGCLLSLPSFVRDNAELQASVRESIVEAVGGMFLLARLYIGSLEHKTTIKALKSAVRQFQKHRQDSSEDERHEALAHAYDETMSRVKGQHEEHRQLAEKVLLWIAYAQRPLTTSELQHALGVELDSHDLDKENIPQVELMTSVCAGLVIADSSGFIRLVHATAQDFFEETKEKWFPNAEAYITNVCVSYLSFNCFTNGRCRTDYEFEKNEYLYPFHPYATGNWGHHARRASDCSHRIIDFLESNSKVASSVQAMMTVREHSVGHKYSQRPPEGVTGLHLAACFGLESIVSALISRNHDPNSKDEFGRTPLSWAAENGHVMVARLLIGNNAKVDLADIDHRTPLMWAIRGGHEEMLHLLIEEMASINSVDVFGVTPLHLAARRGHSTAVSLLLKHGANANRKEVLGGTPLAWALESGSHTVIRMLLTADDGANTFYQCFSPSDASKMSGQVSHGRTITRHTGFYPKPIYWSYEYDKCDHPHTLLFRAVEQNDEVLVRMLVEKGSRPDLEVSRGVTALSLSLREGNDTITSLLLSKIDILTDSVGELGRSLLSRAAEKGNRMVVMRLLQGGSDTESKCFMGRTPLCWSAEAGHTEIVKLLLAQPNVNPDIRDKYGQTPLSLAAMKGRAEVVKLLIENSVVIETIDSDGRTPLWLAAMGGHEVVVKLLLATAKTDPDFKSTGRSYLKGRTPISIASEEGHERVVSILLETGMVDPNSKDADGRTPLSYASNIGHEGIARLLLETGTAYPHLKDDDGQTPMSRAIGHGDQNIVKHLLANGAAMESKDTTALTSLVQAADSSDNPPTRPLPEKGSGSSPWDDTEPSFWTILQQASDHGDNEFVIKLLEERAYVESKGWNKQKLLLYAAKHGHEAILKYLLEMGVEADARDKLGRTPLSYAAEHGHEAILKYLLGMGVDADPRDYYKRTPLSYAAEHGHEAILKYLLEMGVEADPRDFHKQRTPLSYAAEHGPEAILKYLLGMGVEADLSDQEGRTPLSYAAEHGHEAILKYLLEMGVETNLKNKYGETPLSYAAFNGHAAVVKLLLEQGVEPRHDINELLEGIPEKTTLLGYAARGGYEAVVKLLLDTGRFDPDRASGRSCQTPLSYAAEKGSVATVQLLLEYDVDLESKGEFGYTPLLYAVMRGHTAFVRLLLEKGADPITETNWGKTALSFAKSEEMVKLLEMAIESEVYSGFALLGWN